MFWIISITWHTRLQHLYMLEFLIPTCRTAECQWFQWTAGGALLYYSQLEYHPYYRQRRRSYHRVDLMWRLGKPLWDGDLRVIMVKRVPACGASLYRLHRSGIQGSLSCRLLFIPAACKWALGLMLFLCLCLVVDPKQQTIVHDFKTLQHLTWNTHDTGECTDYRFFFTTLKKQIKHNFSVSIIFFHLLPPLSLTRQSLCRVLTRALYVSWSRVRPSGTSLRKSRSLKVGLDFSRSFLDARLL